MNFNEEMERDLSGLKLGGKVVEVRPEDRGTPKDWAELERRIALRVHENEVAMRESALYGRLSLPCNLYF